MSGKGRNAASRSRTARTRRHHTGVTFVWLAALTLLAFVIGVNVRHSLLLIAPIVLVMAALMLVSVMRIGELWNPAAAVESEEAAPAGTGEEPGR